MDVRKKLVIIVSASILLTAVPGAGLIYGFAQHGTLSSESADLVKETAVIADTVMQRFSQGEPKLKSLAHILELELEKPPRPEEIAAFHKIMERNPDGVWRNRKKGYDGLNEAGIFLPPNPQENDAQKIRHLRIKHIMDTFGAAASKPLENVWYLSPHRSEIIFDRTFPNFAFDQKADNDYTQTPWVTYTAPDLNPKREFRFTPPLFDPVPKVWMVSALYPLYVNGQWMGSLGEDMQLSSVLAAMLQNGQIYTGTQHFLLDTQGNFVLAGRWQKQLESTPEAFRPDLSREPQLAALLKSKITGSPQIISDEMVLHDERFVAIGMTLEPLGWKYFRLTPVDEIMAPTRQLFAAIVTMILLVTILTGIMIGTAAGSSITRRIRLLNDAMRGYVGDHHRRASSQLTGSDEISEVAHVFDDMANDIEASILEREEAQIALRKSEELWRFALEGSEAGVWNWSIPDGKVDFSKRWKEMIGYTEDELENSFEEFEKRIHPDDYALVLSKVQQYLQGSEPNYSVEFRLQCKDGSYKWIQARGMTVSRDAAGQPVRMVGTHADITEAKVSAEAILQLNRRMQDMLDAASEVAIIATDENGLITTFNRGAENMLGYTAAEMINKQSPSILHLPSEIEARAHQLSTELGRDISGFEVFTAIPRIKGQEQGEWTYVRKDGYLLTASIAVTTVRSAQGDVTGYLGIALDVTERKMAEAELLASEAFAFSTIDAVSAHLCVLNNSGTILAVNKAWRDFHDANVPEDEIGHYGIGDNYIEICDHSAGAFSEEGHTMSEGIHRVIDGICDEFVLEYPCHSPTEERWFLAKVRRFHGDSGNVVVSHENISQRKIAELAMRGAKESAERLAQSKSEFLANMSHEIRTPMNAIIGLSQLALNKEVSAEVRDYLEKINISSESLLGILNDILDFSKMEAGKLCIDQSRFSLQIILDNLHNLFSLRAEEKHLDFHIEADAAIPGELVGDAMRIQQILSNLLGNAVKFTSQGKVGLHVKLLERENSQISIRFCVSDTGIGISAEDQAKLFQPFSQADTSITRRFGGTGLGLAISQRLLELMGSEFHIESAAGRGAIFCFDLHLGVATGEFHLEHNRRHAERKAGVLSSELRERGEILKGSRILVAEDNRINQQVVKEFLQLSGVAVDIAVNGKEALQLLKENDYDAILMDVHMPEMSGVEATEHIRRMPQYAGLPIIALTAGVTQEERDSCKASGMSDFVAKPVNPEELIGTLCYWVMRKTQLTEETPQAPQPKRSPQPDLKNLPGFDFANLMQMVGGDEALVVQLLKTLLEDSANTLADLETQLGENNLEDARKLVHTIKGSSGNLGATELHVAAQKLEAALKQGHLDQEAYEDFRKVLQKTREVLASLG